jgi:hypothetical protein
VPRCRIPLCGLRPPSQITLLNASAPRCRTFSRASVEEMLAARGISVTHETIRQWGGVVTVTGRMQRVGEVEPCFMRRQPHLATGRLLRL